MFNIFNSHRCYNGGKMHNFSPRFTRKETPTTLSDTAIDRIMRNTILTDTPEVVRNLKNVNKIYIHDICEWCGEIRKGT